MTMNELAELISTSQSALSYIENDKRLPHPETLKKISEALKISNADYKGLLQIRNQLVHGSRPSAYSVSTSISPKDDFLTRDNNFIPNRITNPGFVIEIFPRYATTFEINTKKRFNNDSKSVIGTNQVINTFIEKAIKELIIKDQSWLKQNIEIQLLEYMRDIELLISTNSEKNDIKILEENEDLFRK